MARVNIEEKVFADPRFRALALKLGDEEKAMGRLVFVFRMAQEYWADDGKFIPTEIWDINDYKILEAVGFAERTPDGIYIKGIAERADWLRKKVAAGKVGGRRSVEARLEKYGTSLPINASNNEKSEAQSEAQSEAPPKHPPKPLTLTLTLKSKDKPPRPSGAPPLGTEWLNFGQSWLEFSLRHTKAKNPHASWTAENFGRELSKVSRVTGVSLQDLSAVMKWADTDDFWPGNITSPAGLLKVSKNGNRKVDNLLAAFHKSKDSPLKAKVDGIKALDKVSVLDTGRFD